MLDRGGLYGFFGAGRVHYKMVGVQPIGIAREAYATAAVGLRVTVHQQHIHLGRSKRRSQIDGGRRLTYATFLIGDSYDFSHGFFAASASPAALATEST